MELNGCVAAMGAAHLTIQAPTALPRETRVHNPKIPCHLPRRGKPAPDLPRLRRRGQVRVAPGRDGPR